MGWSWRLLTVAGIGIYVHWTFLLLVAWFLIPPLMSGENPDQAIWRLIFVLSVFACVVLHELGHALTARRYGIQTRDITLYPIGGLARLERMPDDPTQELWVALAGPAVNVVIAAVLMAILAATGKIELPEDDFTGVRSIVLHLALVNGFLVAFNLLPAFPMDGGRVLRALLAKRMDYVRATNVAATVGQAMAIVFGVLGMFWNPMLLFIALFVYLGAHGEATMTQMRMAFRGLPVRQAMMTHFRVLSVDDPLEAAVEELLAGAQHDFPVVEGDRVVGMLLRNDLLRSLASGAPGVRVGDVMKRDCPSVSENEMLDSVFQRMNSDSCSVLPVMRGEKLVGILSLENVGELMMLQTALRRRSGQ
jgi:Zn-dependent protease/predicted transcriptional regulator